MSPAAVPAYPQGFDGFLTSKNAMAKNKNRVFKLDDRLFSLSSVTSPAVRPRLPPTAAAAAVPQQACGTSIICLQA